MSELPAFVAFSMVVIATPGPDTALMIRNTLAGGRSAGLATAAGVALGQVAWAVLTAAGVAGLLAASSATFTIVKVAGACYLAYLGLRALIDAWRGGSPDAIGAVRPRPGLTRRAALRQGLYSNLGNPKMAAFFTGLLPQFASGESPAALLGLGLLFAALTLIWLSAYAGAVSRFRRVLGRRAVKRSLDAVMGTALLALAARLATERRA